MQKMGRIVSRVMKWKPSWAPTSRLLKESILTSHGR